MMNEIEPNSQQPKPIINDDLSLGGDFKALVNTTLPPNTTAFKSFKEVSDYRLKLAQSQALANIQVDSIAHTREGTIPQPKSTCQDRLNISSILKDIFKPSPMPEWVRKMHIEDGDDVSDLEAPYQIVGGKKGEL